MKPLHNKFILAGSAALLACSIGLAQPALAATQGVNVYRLYNTWTHEHLYTANLDEYNGLVAKGWNGEGVGFVTPEDGSDQVDGQVYRLFNPNNKEHLYTKDSAEVERLKTIGWKYEAVAWNSAKSDQTPVYRLFNPYVTEFTHYYTQNTTDRDENVARGMRSEAIAWYALNVTPDQDAQGVLDNLSSILGGLSSSSSSSSGSSSYDSLDTDPQTADSIVTQAEVDESHVVEQFNKKKNDLTAQETATQQKKNVVDQASAAVSNATPQDPSVKMTEEQEKKFNEAVKAFNTAQEEFLAELTKEIALKNDVADLEKQQADLEKKKDEAQCGRANNQYRRINSVCEAIASQKKSLADEVTALNKQITDLKTRKDATLYQDKKAIQNDIDAKTKEVTKKNQAITNLNNLYNKYSDYLTEAINARSLEHAVMIQSDRVIAYANKVQQAQSALDSCRSTLESLNLKEQDGKTPKDIETMQAIVDAKAFVAQAIQDEKQAEQERNQARSAAANSRGEASKTLEGNIKKAEDNYLKEIQEALTVK